MIVRLTVDEFGARVEQRAQRVVARELDEALDRVLLDVLFEQHLVVAQQRVDAARRLDEVARLLEQQLDAVRRLLAARALNLGPSDVVLRLA